MFEFSDDDGFEIEDYALIGAVFAMFEDELEEEYRRKKFEEEMLNPDGVDPEELGWDHEEEDQS